MSVSSGFRRADVARFMGMAGEHYDLRKFLPPNIRRELGLATVVAAMHVIGDLFFAHEATAAAVVSPVLQMPGIISLRSFFRDFLFAAAQTFYPSPGRQTHLPFATENALFTPPKRWQPFLIPGFRHNHAHILTLHGYETI